MSEWQDITITDLDERLSERIEPGRNMWRFYFKLSAEAPTVWRQIFEEGRRFPRHTMWRRAEATSKHIVLKAAPEEIEMHKSDLDEDMAYTNATYRKHLELMLEQEKREAETTKDDHSLLKDLRQKLFGD